MKRISYAQNFEDVMLWRALEAVPSGFYIDVGANDPVTDSVTKIFYDAGWNGINIEPLISCHEALCRERPRDVNLRCAAADTESDIKIWDFGIRGWASGSQHVVDEHRAKGLEAIPQNVAASRLATICEQYAPQDIHFLKIDVEGAEKSVIDGMDFSRFRPWILVVEATYPDSRKESHREWESRVLNSGYQLVYVDGLNRFYLAAEHEELREHFRYPPNVFDQFVHQKQVLVETQARELQIAAEQAETRAERERAHAREVESRIERVRIRAQRAEANAEHAEAVLLSVRQSTTWRLTAPLRKTLDLLKNPNQVGSYMGSRVKGRSKAVLAATAHYLSRKPTLKAATMMILTLLPGLRDRLKQVVANASFMEYGDFEKEEGPAGQSPHARWIYMNIKAAMERREEHN